MNKKHCIIITGPTASGKTNLALSIARHFNTAIVSADSRQCYIELNIGVAKPHPEQLAEIKHYFINSHSIHTNVNAAAYEQYALGALDSIFAQNDIAIVVGGTGLYIRALCEGMDAIPAIDQQIRQALNSQYSDLGLEWLQRTVKEKDPGFYEHGEIYNPQRMLRALEVVLSTGRPIRSFQERKKMQRDFNIIKIGLDLPRPLLYQHIEQRVDEIMEQGLLEEVTALLPYRSLNALQTVGYTEIFDCMEGRTNLEEAVVLIKRNTRHYAKRQLTWFRKDNSIQWYTNLEHNQIISDLQALVH